MQATKNVSPAVILVDQPHDVFTVRSNPSSHSTITLKLLHFNDVFLNSGWADPANYYRQILMLEALYDKPALLVPYKSEKERVLQWFQIVPPSK